jgi:hypothetical protein
MPRALEVPETIRASAQALVIQGFTFSEISSKTGVNQRTVQTWARRYGWLKLREKPTESLNPAGQEVTENAPENERGASVSIRVRQKLGQEYEKQLDALQKIAVVSKLPHLSERAVLTDKIAAGAAKTFGWASTQPGGMIRVGEMRSVTVVESAAPSPEEAQAQVQVEPAADQIIDVPIVS